MCELVANACAHAGGPTQLLRSRGERLRVEVADRDARRPEPRRAADPGRPGGYGLLIMEELAQAWGSTRGAEGKWVWLEIRARAA
ncbi:ATP-binding protein [Streptomyces sp. NBC_01310]|uniref:ATP-binding protein n=1 Tax=Streptomyces sp. NBC_01310 TaxID=2903820 RepID=UPI0035B6A3AD|nr:ATP-binding protein [Streptomyces sp. NBC_01310]